MPHIKLTTNVTISQPQEETLKKKFGSAIGKLGKTENYLMVELADNARLWFRGENKPSAIVNVKLFGKASRQQYQAFSDETIALLNRELSIAPSQIYVKFEEVDNWFWA